MPNTASREIRLASRPKGVPTEENFALAEITLEPLQDQQVLVRNLFMSVDPYMRGRMNEGESYVAPFALDKPLEGGAVGEVVESRATGFKPGDAVTSNFGWRECFMAAPKQLHRVSREIQPLSVYLGAIGMTGMTAWVGLGQSGRCDLHLGCGRSGRKCGGATREITGGTGDRLHRFHRKGQVPVGRMWV